MTQKQHKVLIIKVGYSETLDSEISNITSYGDVLRSTVLLNLYKEDHVTWLVDEKALPILKGNPYIDRILIYNLTSVLQLQAEHFDTVINLEKVPGFARLQILSMPGGGMVFVLMCSTGEAEAYDRSHVVLEMCRNIEKKRNRKAYWQEGLFEMVGAEWKGEEYVLGYQPKAKEKYDIGFNYQVGNKWPLKGWPMAYWKELENLIGKKYSISWQQGLDDMEDYFEWINSCRVLVTNDSFGMHIAIAMKKRFIAIFGPTQCQENCLYDYGVAFHPQEGFCELFPCNVPKCPHFEDGCTTLTKPETIFKAIEDVLKPSHITTKR